MRGTGEIRTGRLLLRKFTPDDAQDVYEHFGSSEEVYKNLPYSRHQNLEESIAVVNLWVERYREDRRYNWCIDLADKGVSAIGAIYLINFDKEDKSFEVGFCLGTEWWNQGIMTEALRGVCEYIDQEGDIRFLWGGHVITNPGSGKVFTKAGFSPWDRYDPREDVRFYKKDCQIHNTQAR